MAAISNAAGKTLLLESLAILATNRRASVLSLGHDDADTEKRLTGVLTYFYGFKVAPRSPADIEL